MTDAGSRPRRSVIRHLISVIRGVFAIFAVVAGPAAAGEPVKIGMVRSSASGAVYLAQERGYFAAEGLESQLVFFDSAQPISVAVVSGDVDVGVTGITAAFFNLAGQGALRIIAGANQEMPSFAFLGHVVSNQAYQAGLKSFADYSGHSFALTQMGSSLQYDLAMAAEKYGFDLASMRILALQSNANVSSAIAGGQVDCAVLPVTQLVSLLAHGQGRLMGWAGDVTPGIQANIVFTAAGTANERRQTVERFLSAYVKGTRELHTAFVGPDGRRHDGPASPAILAIIAKYVGVPVDEVKLAIPYVDEEARLDVDDIMRQIAWFKAQNLLKGEVDGKAIIDGSYVRPMTAR